MEDNWGAYEPVAGGFREDSFKDRMKSMGRSLKNKFRRTEKPKPSYANDLIEQYEFFRENLHNPERVFYPCSHLDASPLRGFPDSEIVLIDNDPNLKKIMEKAGIEQFISGDVLKYSPENSFDLVIALNPSLPSSDLTKHLANRGYVLANNWHNNASQLLEDSDFDGIGTIDRNENGIYLAKGDFSKLEPNQFATYFYVFRKIGENEK